MAPQIAGSARLSQAVIAGQDRVLASSTETAQPVEPAVVRLVLRLARNLLHESRCRARELQPTLGGADDDVASPMSGETLEFLESPAWSADDRS